MLNCAFEIGDNLYKALVGAGVTLAPLLAALTVRLQRQMAKELVTNGGLSVKDSVHRTEATVAAIAESQGVPHPTPIEGIPITTKEV